MKLKVGKVPGKLLEGIVFKNLGMGDEKVKTGPRIGGDAAIVQFGDKYMVIASDPLIGARRDVGWYAVNINANDVAVCGARPKYFLETIILPEGTKSERLEEICRQVDSACREFGITVVGGHSEVTRYVDHGIISGTMIGFSNREKIIFPGSAREGDTILITKHAGLEGASLLAMEKADILEDKVPKKLLDEASGFSQKISVVKEALLASDSGLINSMHDPTEGGVLTGVIELARAAGKGFIIYKDKIPVHKATQKICEALELDPYRLISSGALLLTTSKENVEPLKALLKTNDIPVEEIGKITAGNGLIRSGDTEKSIPLEEQVEELWKGLTRQK
jgi:thiamin-phosphate kinase